jgi:hypothetical protein
MEGLRLKNIQIGVKQVTFVALTLQLCILKILGSNPNPDTFVSVEGFCVLTQQLQTNAAIVPQIW